MTKLVSLMLGCLAGTLLARHRPFWMRVVAIGAFLGIAHTLVERDPIYLWATVVLGAAFYLGARRGTGQESGVQARGG